MKSLYIIFSLLFYGYSSFAQTGAEEKLVNAITLALRTESDSLLYKCLPSQNDFRKLFEIQKLSSGEEMLDASTIHKYFKRAASHTFKETLNTGRRKGVNWNSIAIIKSELKEEVQEGEHLKKGDIYITYKENNHQFVVKLVDCIKVKEEWKLMNRIWWYETL